MATSMVFASCIDAYDNYESYIPWLKLLHVLKRRALSRADLITAAGPNLLKQMLFVRFSLRSYVEYTSVYKFQPLRLKAA